MATLLEAYNLRYTATTLKSRVITGIAKVAIDIYLESPATNNHANRIIWAADALINTQTIAERIMWAVVADPAILAAGDNATDSEVLTAVTNAVNVLAIGS